MLITTQQSYQQNANMFALFDLEWNDEEANRLLKNYDNYGRFADHKKKIHNGIKQYLLSDKSLDATAMEQDWFPKINAPVFISHSHNDRTFAMQLAEFLHKKCKIESFVDSMIWDNVFDLLKDIDNNYCAKFRSSQYNYNKRNQSTANAYIILQGALMKMISRSKCVIFINTPHSININDSSNNENNTTSSPWIYNELLMANLFYQMKSLKTFTESDSESKELRIQYNVDLTNFAKISLQDIINICDGKTELKALNALNELYKRHIKLMLTSG